jgi:hypothetical protein
VTNLYHAPPRLSDLRGDELREALAERHRRNREAWLQNRTQESRTAKVARWIMDRIEGAGA